jgi:hypothetical protein
MTSGDFADWSGAALVVSSSDQRDRTTPGGTFLFQLALQLRRRR